MCVVEMRVYFIDHSILPFKFEIKISIAKCGEGVILAMTINIEKKKNRLFHAHRKCNVL